MEKVLQMLEGDICRRRGSASGCSLVPQPHVAGVHDKQLQQSIWSRLYVSMGAELLMYLSQQPLEGLLISFGFPNVVILSGVSYWEKV